METSVQVRVVCACGQEAVRESSTPLNTNSTESLDLYRCPSGHVTQVLHSLIPQSSFERRKPTLPPSFPGGSW
jgi:hypothetical protein